MSPKRPQALQKTVLDLFLEGPQEARNLPLAAHEPKTTPEASRNKFYNLFWGALQKRLQNDLLEGSGGILGSCWGHFGIMLGAHRNQLGVMLGSFW